MTDDRVLHAYCPACDRPRPHSIIDEGSCRCTECGRVELLMVPLDERAPVVALGTDPGPRATAEV